MRGTNWSGRQYSDFWVKVVKTGEFTPNSGGIQQQRLDPDDQECIILLRTATQICGFRII